MLQCRQRDHKRPLTWAHHVPGMSAGWMSHVSGHPGGLWAAGWSDGGLLLHPSEGPGSRRTGPGYGSGQPQPSGKKKQAKIDWLCSSVIGQQVKWLEWSQTFVFIRMWCSVFPPKSQSCKTYCSCCHVHFMLFQDGWNSGSLPYLPSTLTICPAPSVYHWTL